MSFSVGVKKRLERANWHAFALSKMTTATEVARVRKWIKENLAGDSHVEAMKEQVGNRRRSLATFVRIKDEDDAFLFKLQWASFE